jgi:MYXO-CTERM domain-containing protein
MPLRSNCSTSSVSGNATSGGALLAGLGALGLVVGRLRRRRAR